jgi:hypothetical protein
MTQIVLHSLDVERIAVTLFDLTSLFQFFSNIF